MKTRPPACPLCRGAAFVPFVEGVIENGKIGQTKTSWLHCVLCNATGMLPDVIVRNGSIPADRAKYLAAAKLN